MYADFATKGLSIPVRRFGDPQPRPKPDSKIQQHLQDITRFVNVDAASDEILSASQMKGLVGASNNAVHNRKLVVLHTFSH